MLKQLFIALLVPTFACAIVNAQELSPIHQPTLTPQDSGTTSGLIAVWPVNPQVVWASGRNGTFTVTTDGEILTNNSEDGAATHPLGRQVHWDVGPGSTKIPETLIKLR